jgi:hypothetical protein
MRQEVCADADWKSVKMSRHRKRHAQSYPGRSSPDERKRGCYQNRKADILLLVRACSLQRMTLKGRQDACTTMKLDLGNRPKSLHHIQPPVFNCNFLAYSCRHNTYLQKHKVRDLKMGELYAFAGKTNTKIHLRGINERGNFKSLWIGMSWERKIENESEKQISFFPDCNCSKSAHCMHDLRVRFGNKENREKR